MVFQHSIKRQADEAASDVGLGKTDRSSGAALIMDDYAVLKAEIQRCQSQLFDLNAEIDFILAKKPIHLAALENVMRRLRHAVERLEALAGAIIKGRGSQERQ